MEKSFTDGRIGRSFLQDLLKSGGWVPSTGPTHPPLPVSIMKFTLPLGVLGAFFVTSSAHAVTTSVNAGSLGAAGNGTKAVAVVLGRAGPLAAPGDFSAAYAGGANTTVPYNAAVNPSSSSPFTIEFWTKPDVVVNDSVGPSPVFNRVSSGNRSGWVFFQRSPGTGFNFAMYNGTGSTVGIGLTGGPYTVGAWNHVVAVWNGTTPSLYVNGVNTLATVTGPGGYNASGSATFSVGAYDTGSNPFTGSVDETAFYATALTSEQISSHFAAAANPTSGAYAALIQGDGAVLYLNNVPEPGSAGLALLALGGLMQRRRRSC
jgi:MYXO-CTERM domain-containing protein